MKVEKITDLNKLSKSKKYRMLSTEKNDEQTADDWMKYRGTPNATVLQFTKDELMDTWYVEEK